MTFSICVRERYAVATGEAEPGSEETESEGTGSEGTPAEGMRTEGSRAEGTRAEESGHGETERGDSDDVRPETHYRFGVAVTTRLPAVGVLCPFANGHGAVATQSRVNVELGRRGIESLADGLGVEDALQGLLDADGGAPERQLHGVDRESEFAFSGEECNPWYGDVVGDGYTVAGNLLTGESVVSETAAAYEDLRVTGEPDGSVDTDRDGAADHEPLVARLVEALAAGQTQGGDKREELTIQSAAVVVATSEDVDREELPLYDDLRVDATETPVEDLGGTVATTVETQQFLEERAEEEDGGGD
ncbi:MAG: DUF1028 domain-containing protein [Haloarculaceae archaeon]